MERLTDYFIPSHYDLDLTINKYSEEVEGYALVSGELTNYARSSQLLKFHSKGLTFSSIKVNGKPSRFDLDPVTETVVIYLTTTAREISCEFCYTFSLNHNMEGAYLSTYEFNGQEERIVTTQCESHYAREILPCIDEPAAKATFSLTLTNTDPADTTLSNMPAKTEKISSVGKTTTFETTPKMSTYLLAFVMGKFHKKSLTNAHGVEVTTYAALNQSKNSLDFPTKIAADTLDLYDDLFDTKYPLPKLDQVAIPDFEAGAMENWGLVTYREACLLVDKTTSQSEKEYIATVITHELSHQWFGNLVTMAWWDNLWLNESFANMMQYVAADRLHPEWKVWQDFFTSDCYYALRRDALPGVQSVQQEVHDPAEIATLFDSAIVYAKGAHLMFMLMRLMGEENFFTGLKSYFKDFAYQNTSGDNLWDSLQPYATFNVKDFMNAWISQPGYPMITDGAMQRFLLTGATDDTKWPLPEITDDMSGHYIINLASNEFADKLAHFDELTLEQKLRLLIDRELLAQTPIVSAGSLMDLLPKFKNETSEPIWEIVSDIIGLLKVFCLPDSKYYKPYQTFVYDLIESNLQSLGYTPKKHEDDSDTKLRAIILNFALYTEDPQSETKLTKLYLDDFAAIPSEIRGSVLIAKLRSLKEKNLDQLIAAYRNTSDPSVKSDLLAAITSCREPGSIKKVLELLEKPKIVRPQDHLYLLAYLLTNFYSRDKAYAWFYTHWDYIISLTSDKSMDDYIRVAAARIRTEQEADQFFAFVKPYEDSPSLARSIDIARTDILARLRWIKDNATAVQSRLKPAQ